MDYVKDTLVYSHDREITALLIFILQNTASDYYDIGVGEW